jgi:hypothetical protein
MKMQVATAAIPSPASTGMSIPPPFGGLGGTASAALAAPGALAACACALDGGLEGTFPDGGGSDVRERAGGATDGMSSSKSPAEASGVVLARSAPASSDFAMILRSTIPESCSGEEGRPDEGGDGRIEGGAGVRDEEGERFGELASLARS